MLWLLVNVVSARQERLVEVGRIVDTNGLLFGWMSTVSDCTTVGQ